MADIITFYDLPGNASKDSAWSPNTWKARFALNIKGLKYKTIWVEYPDIADAAKKAGAKPTGVRADGSPMYTVPFLHDPHTGAVVSESWEIVKYLDVMYPSTPRLVPHGTGALQAAFLDTITSKLRSAILPLLIVQIVHQLPPRSAEYFRRTREATFGKCLEDILPDSERPRGWKDLFTVLSEIDRWMNETGEGKIFVMGDSPTFADVVIMSYFAWIKRILSSDSDDWKSILAANGGRWGRLEKAFEGWNVVDEEGIKTVLTF